MKASWPQLAACLLPLTFVAATCKREVPQDPPPVAVASASTGAPRGASADGGKPTAELPTPRPEDLPGVPVGEMAEPAAKQLFAFAQDDFCYCGCPHTVQACLKEHGGCRHAKRMMMIGALEAEAGAKSSEITKLLNDYYASFAPEKRTRFELTNAACMGPDSAPVTIVEFSDFECPYCAMARPVLEELVPASKGRVRLCFKPFPLGIHPHSGPAAEAAMYAREHGKFWELHDLMFTNQAALDEASLKTYAQKIGLDGDDMLKAVAAQKYVELITASKEEGKRAGIDGTPSIFINGRPLVLQPAPELLAHAVEDELEWKQNNGHWGAD